MYIPNLQLYARTALFCLHKSFHIYKIIWPQHCNYRKMQKIFEDELPIFFKQCSTNMADSLLATREQAETLKCSAKFLAAQKESKPHHWFY